MDINKFKEIQVNDYQKFIKCTNGNYNNSESSFATMYMWQHYANVKYSIENDTIFSIYKNRNGNYSSFMPYGKKRNSLDTIKKLIELYNELNSPLIINLCTEDFVDFIKNNCSYKIKVTEQRNSFDYVYYTQELIELKGKKFHSKKNHINTFTKKYPYEYVRYNNEMKHSCIEFCKNVLVQHYGMDENAYKTELFSITKTFDNLDDLNLKCGLLTLDDKIIALSVGERLNNEYALIHIEKADYNYRSSYSVINNLFLKNEFSDTIYVNREEDMGIEGLRIAKKSYNPCKMIKKYTVEFE